MQGSAGKNAGLLQDHSGPSVAAGKKFCFSLMPMIGSQSMLFVCEVLSRLFDWSLEESLIKFGMEITAVRWEHILSISGSRPTILATGKGNKIILHNTLKERASLRKRIHREVKRVQKKRGCPIKLRQSHRTTRMV